MTCVWENVSKGHSNTIIHLFSKMFVIIIQLETLGSRNMVDDPFEALRRRFLTRCRGDLEALEAIACKTDATPPSEIDRGLLVKVAHSLAGAGGTFGFGLSERASDVESLLIAENAPDPAQIRTVLDELVLELKRITS